jgi:hypothetical protein
MRSFVVLFGLCLTGSAFAAGCKQPSTPDFPAETPIAERAENKLSRDVARYIEDFAKYVGCLRADDSLDPSTVAEKESAAVRDMRGLIDLYETRVGHSDKLIAEIAGSADPALLDRVAATHRARDTEAIATLNVAIADINAGRHAEARAGIGELDFDSLTPFERSKAEQVLYTVAYKEENFEEAREHVQKSIDAGGLSRQEVFNARLALVNIDVMLRLRNTPERSANQRIE